MSALWTAKEAQAATGGRIGGDWSATGVSIDTRSLQAGDLFVALADARDGHDFVAQALQKGAAAALVSRMPVGVTDDARLLIVSDVLEALEALGRAARARMTGKVVAVTGSVGKTSTKEMLRTALAGQGRIHAAEKSFNNHWGVPLTLARMPADTDFAIMELGMNHPGEIGPLSRLCRPHVAMITMVAAVHMEAFTSVKQIARAKAEIFEGLEPGGAAVINRDIPTYAILARAAKRAGAVAYRYGFAGRPEFAMTFIRTAADSTMITYRHNSQKFHARIGAPGKHLSINGLGVIAVIEALEADPALAAINLSRWSPPEGRGSRSLVTIGDADPDDVLLLIDESYNSNPTSLAAALEALADAPVSDGRGRVAKGRRIAVIGDMRELGSTSPELHAGIAGLAAMARIDRVHTVGAEALHLRRALPDAKRGRHADTVSELIGQLHMMLDAGDTVMVKASNSVGLAKLVDAIKAMGQTRGASSDTRETI